MIRETIEGIRHEYVCDMCHIGLAVDVSDVEAALVREEVLKAARAVNCPHGFAEPA